MRLINSWMVMLAVIAALCSMARFWSVTRAGGTMATLRNSD